MAFAKGKSGNPKGRPVGTRNKMPMEVKSAILAALNDDRGGRGVEFFLKLKTSRSAADRHVFAQLCGKLLPRIVEGDVNVTDLPGRVVVYVPSNGRGPAPVKQTEEGED